MNLQVEGFNLPEASGKSPKPQSPKPLQRSGLDATPKLQETGHRQLRRITGK